MDKKVTNVFDIKPTKSIINFNAGGLTIPVKIQSLQEWTKNMTQPCVVYRNTYLKCKDTYGLIKEQRMVSLANTNQNKDKDGIGTVILIKTDLRKQKTTRDKEERYIIIKRSVIQGDITTFNMYVHKNIKIHKANMDGTERKIGKSTTVIGGLPHLLSVIDRLSRQRINRGAEDLRSTFNPVDLLDTYKIFNPTTGKYTFSKLTWNIHHDRACSWKTYINILK